MDINIWLAFLVAAVVIAVTPGPGAVLSIATGLRYGYANALRAIIGLEAALLVQLLVVGLGLGALLAASSGAFLALKVVGAGYLVYLGVSKWRAPVEELDEGSALPRRRGGLFLQGLLVNLTNPKALIFMVALVPQFVTANLPDRESAATAAVRDHRGNDGDGGPAGDVRVRAAGRALSGVAARSGHDQDAEPDLWRPAACSSRPGPCLRRRRKPESRRARCCQRLLVPPPRAGRFLRVFVVLTMP